MRLLVPLQALTVAMLATVLPLQPATAATFSASFVEAFISACTPERTSFSKTVAHARSLGWSEVETASNAELAAMIKRSEKGIAEGRAEGYLSGYEMTVLSRVTAGRPLHLIVSLTRSKYLDMVGCYLYDFEATAPLDRAEVTRALGIEPANKMDTPELVSAVWGPSPRYSRTFDTYLSFVPPGSPHAAKTGFDGAVLKFTVSAAKEPADK
ncbi:MAG: hypothetical protein ACK5JT_21245 [Hyphomicrobiaceae bacterium]